MQTSDAGHRPLNWELTCTREGVALRLDGW